MAEVDAHIQKVDSVEEVKPHVLGPFWPFKDHVVTEKWELISIHFCTNTPSTL